MTIFPSWKITVIANLILWTSIGFLGVTFRQTIQRYFNTIFGQDSAPKTRETRDSYLIGTGSGALVAFLLFAIGLPWIVSLAGAIISFIFTPRYYKNKRRKEFVAEFDKALPESLRTISSSLRAGLTLKDAFTVAADNCPPVFANEMKTLLKEYHFGIPMEKALDNIRKRIGTPNCSIVFGAMIISTNLGGNLPATLERIVATVTERDRVEGKLKALTAQGKAQAFLLCSTPPLIGIGMAVYDPAKMRLLTDTLIGQILLTLAVVLEVVGIVVTYRVVQLEV